MKPIYFKLLIILFSLFSCSDNSPILFLKTNDAGGLNEKTKVKMNGLQFGQINSVVLDKDYHVIVEIKFKKELKIPIDSKFRIITEDILGNKIIELTPGISEKTMKNNDTVFAINDPGIALDSLALNFKDLIKNATDMDKVESLTIELKRLNQNIDSLNKANKINPK